MTGQTREYRRLMKPTGLYALDISEGESDLKIFTSGECPTGPVRELLLQIRQEISDYIQENPLFLSSLRPVPVPPRPRAPAIIRHMAHVATVVGVGPMAAVAGAVAQYIGVVLAREHSEVIIENGGDLFLQSTVPRSVLVHAGLSPFSERLKLVIPPGTWGICTSAGTIGHSLSFGRADAVVVVAKDTLLADAAATALGNMVKVETDIALALDTAAKITGIEGAVVIIGEKMGAWGSINLMEAGG